MCAIMLLFHFFSATQLTHGHFATVIKSATGIFVHMTKWRPNVNTDALTSDADEGKDEDVAQNAKRRRFQHLIS